jgi:hypothetical protein
MHSNLVALVAEDILDTIRLLVHELEDLILSIHLKGNKRVILHEVVGDIHIDTGMIA